MDGWMRNPLRVAGKLAWLSVELVVAAVDFARRRLWRTGPGAAGRALWLQQSSRRLLRVLGIVPVQMGRAPSGGLLVSNHLGYLDVLVLSSLAPAVFVAKAEVRNWPVFGWFARQAGTVFVQRERRSRAGREADEIAERLEAGALVVLFPEGTSSDGRVVLPFKSSLLEPAVARGHPLAAAAIHYELDDGRVDDEVCYWRDMTLVPHLLNLLGKRTVRASV